MLALLALSTALAGEITWTFDAVATANVDSEYDGQLPSDTALSGFITFDEPSDSSGTYANVVIDAEFSFLGNTWTLDQVGSAAVQDGTSDTFNAAWTFAGPNLVGTGGRPLTPATLNLFLADAQGGIFNSAAFPDSPPDLSAIDTNQFIVRFNDTVGGGQPSAVFSITAWEIQDSCPDSPLTSPGTCGCDYEDVDVTGGVACVHVDANVDPSATLGAGVQVDEFADVGAATIGASSRVARSASIEPGATLGERCIVARAAQIRSDVSLGNDCLIQRTAQIGNDVTAGTNFSVGYGSIVAASSTFGNNVVLAADVEVQDIVVGDNAVLARGARMGTGSTVGALTVVGPDVTVGDNAELGERVRIRKSVQIGDRVTLGDNTRIGRDGVLGDDSGTRDNVSLRAEVELGTFAHLPADESVPRGESFPNDYDHDDDGVLSLAMGGTDCNDFDARFIELCEIDLVTVGGARQWADGSYASSCDTYRNPTGIETYGGDAGSGLYNIDPDADGTPFAAYCDMATTTGWTLAAVVASGASSNWTYDSTWWTVTGSAQQPNPSPSDAEGRYEAFDASAYTAIRLVDPASGREVRITDSASSLVSRFATTPPPTLTDNGNGGHAVSGLTVLPHTRYDTNAFSFLSLQNSLDICDSTLTSNGSGWVANPGIGLNTAGRYDASNGLFASGKARIGNWTGGSNSHIWEQTADCGLGLGVQTTRDGSNADTGTTMGTQTIIWIQ